MSRPTPSSGEQALHDWLASRPGTGTFVGDDLAVLGPAGGTLLVGVDPVLDGVHLLVREAGHAAAGRKAMNRNLSDVAAMGATPVAATLSILAPRDLTMEQAKQIIGAAEAAGDLYNCPLVGGDFATWGDDAGKLAVTVSILARADQPVPRRGARVGDTLFVTGALGGSIFGRHLTFTPRVDLGQTLAGKARAMLDLSDGLGRDLPRLLGELGARLDHIPIHQDAHQHDDGRDPIWHAIYDGEDYELLLAGEASLAKEIPELIAIGVVTQGPGIELATGDAIQTLKPGGWNHTLGSTGPRSS